MLGKIGNTIEKRPWFVIIIILLITGGFAGLLPSIEMQTSMDQFLPEDDVVVAQDRINDYFSTNYEVIMVYIEKNKENVISPASLKEEYRISKELEKYEEIEGILGISGMVNTVCQMEYNESLINCTDEQITTAFNDLMAEYNTSSNVKFIEDDDINEDIDYNSYPRLTKGKLIDSFDIKNFYIKEVDGNICFSIEVYDLSDFESDIEPPIRSMNVMEWYIDFKNLIIPDERMDMNYKIAAHIEPKNEFWQIGRGLVNNFKSIINSIKNKELLNVFDVETYLWITQPEQDLSFPIILEGANITFNIDNNQIEIIVPREELGKYGIAPEFDGFGLPARIGNARAGFRFYQVPFLKLPWLGYTVNMSSMINTIERIQTRQIIGGFSGRILNLFTGFTWEDFNEIFSMLDETGLSIETMSLKDMAGWWVITDEAPDDDKTENTFYIKPSFLEEMRKNIQSFLTEDYDSEDGAFATLMMIQINGSLSYDELIEISRELVDEINNQDQKQDLFSLRATGATIMDYEINDVSMEANGIVVPGIFISISLILFISFRRISYVVLPLLGLTIAIIWLFGTMVLLGMEFMIMEIALIPMLMGLGVDYSVHLFHNYRTELDKGKTPGKAISASIEDIGIAMLLATITTFIAFLSFLTVSMIPLRDFGVLCAIGISYVFIITITLQAAIRFILDRRRELKGKVIEKKSKNGKFMRATAKIVCNHPLTMLIITIIATLILFTGAMQIETGFNMEDFLPEENPSVKVMNEISDVFPFSSQEKEYVLIEGDIATVATLNGIQKTINNVEDDKFVLITSDGDPKVISILSIISKATDRNTSLIEKYNIDSNGIPRTDEDVEKLLDYLYDNDNYAYETRGCIYRDSENYEATMITIYTDMANGESDDLSNAMGILYDELNSDINVDYGGPTAIATGDNTMMHVIMNSMTESQILSTGICIILAGIVLIIAYRKPILGLIAMIPVSISTIWIIGTMYFIGYSLNVMTIMITSLTIGLGITYAIHAVERFRLTADRTGDVITAVSETIGHTGGALLIAAITTMVGFGLLILTPMPVEQQFGLITALTILYAFLTSMFILPPALMFWGRWKKKTKGYIISPDKK